MSLPSRFTIITPSFNRRWAIEACLKSLQKQSVHDYEHLIIDGGSTDGTLDLLAEYADRDERIRYISERDNGMYDAVNKGLTMATGDIVAYLNTDDFYLPGALQAVAEACRQEPELSMVYGHWMSWHPETGFVEMMPVFRYSPADLALFAVLPQPSVFFRRSVLDAVGGFDLSFKLLADNEFFSRVAVAGLRCRRIDAYLSVQTVHSGNLLAGNPEAAERALAEGERYRKARRKELARRRPLPSRLCPMLLASAKKALLPATWRLHLLLCLLTARSDAQRAPWKQLEGEWSAAALLQYLFSRRRWRSPFFRVKPTSLARHLGFPAPDPRAGPARPEP